MASTAGSTDLATGPAQHDSLYLVLKFSIYNSGDIGEI